MFKQRFLCSKRKFNNVDPYLRLLLGIMADKLKEPSIRDAVVTDDSFIEDYLDVDENIKKEQIILLSRSLEFVVSKNLKMIDAVQNLVEVFGYSDYYIE